jgi:hypothetical protein
MSVIATLWFAAAVFLLLYTILLGRKLSSLWLILAGIAPVVIVHVVNPSFRVWSFHSLLHGGIVYQILNGNLPPPRTVSWR